MKTFSRPFTIVIILVVALIAVATFRAYASRPPWKDAAYGMKINKARKYIDPKMTDEQFKILLQSNDAIYCIKVKKDETPAAPVDLTGNDCSGDLTTMASVDDATRELVLTCGGSRVTQRIGFNSAQQLLNVDKALAAP